MNQEPTNYYKVEGENGDDDYNDDDDENLKLEK